MAARNKRGGAGGSFEAEFARVNRYALDYGGVCDPCRAFLVDNEKIKRRGGTKGGQKSIRRGLVRKWQDGHKEGGH